MWKIIASLKGYGPGILTNGTSLPTFVPTKCSIVQRTVSDSDFRLEHLIKNE